MKTTHLTATVQLPGGAMVRDFALCEFSPKEGAYVSPVAAEPLLATVDRIGRRATREPRRVILVDLVTGEALYTNLAHPAAPGFREHHELAVSPVFWHVLKSLKAESLESLTATKVEVADAAFVEAVTATGDAVLAAPCNWGKFLVHALPNTPGLLVVDLQTCEGSVIQFGAAPVPQLLERRSTWVCVLYEAVLGWLEEQAVDRAGVPALPSIVVLPQVPFALVGRRRPGRAPVLLGRPEVNP